MGRKLPCAAECRSASRLLVPNELGELYDPAVRGLAPLWAAVG